MAVVHADDTILEEREEFMVSPTGGIPSKRTAHFLKPVVSSMQGPNLKLPLLSPKSKWPLDVAFNGWREPEKKWSRWVEHMHAKNYRVWRQAGILEAVMASKYIIHRNDELVLGIVERWCSDTNTFVLPWGETTITLEDVMILGGFSVLGAPVLLPLEGKELFDVGQTLKKVCSNLERMKRRNHFQWLNFFMKSGNEYEHEAFLSLWLSRFVFPGNEFDKIEEHVFPIAVHLARGTRIALAPAVLASIYRDLSLLKETMAASTQLEAEEGQGNILALSLWAPLYLLQLWAWERLLPFRPGPNFLNFGELRIARWHDLNKLDIGNVRPILDSCGEVFLWRPFCLTVDNWSCPKFYKKKEEWALIGKYPDEELESLARCLRPCVLLGIDCEERYNPHRVAMQFGYDQDLPGWIPRGSNAGLELAWIDYSRPLSNGATLYLPSRMNESDVSVRYLEWWRNSVLVPVDSILGLVQRKRSSRKPAQKCLPNSKQVKVEVNGPDVAPDYPRRYNTMEEYNQNPILRLQTSNRQQFAIQGNYLDVPPGFPPKFQGARLETCTRHQIKPEVNDPDVPPGFPPKFGEMKENSPTQIQMQRQRKTPRTNEDSHKVRLFSNFQFEGVSSSITAMGASGINEQQATDPVGITVNTEAAGGGSRIFGGHAADPGGGNSNFKRNRRGKEQRF